MNKIRNNESQLWSKLRRGHIDALNELYNIHADLLYDYGIKLTTDSESVMDCIHDLFLDLYKYRKKLAKEVHVSSYLLKSLKRKIVERYKDKIILLSPEDDYSARIFKNEECSIEEEIIRNEEKFALNLNMSNSLKSLTRKQQEVITLRFTENRSYEEIALDMGVSIQTARTTLYRAIKELRRKISY